MSETFIRGLTAETLADQAYETLRSAITSGELARGEKVTERGLAQRLEVSPTSVREAIRRLEQDHLIEGSSYLRWGRVRHAGEADAVM